MSKRIVRISLIIYVLLHLAGTSGVMSQCAKLLSSENRGTKRGEAKEITIDGVTIPSAKCGVLGSGKEYLLGEYCPGPGENC